MPTDNNDIQEELQRLRATNADLLKAKHNLKAKVEELEAKAITDGETITLLQTEVDTNKKTIHDATVGAPLRKLASEVSSLPDIWQAEFEKRFNVVSSENGLALQTKDGKPVIDKDGAAVQLTANNLWRFLTGGSGTKQRTEEQQRFYQLMHYFGANGAGASGARNHGLPMNDAATPAPKQKSIPQLGLR